MIRSPGIFLRGSLTIRPIHMSSQIKKESVKQGKCKN